MSVTEQEIYLEMEVSVKVGCLPYAVGKQPSIPWINLERKRMLR